MNIPNLLTLVRIFFVPLLVAALVQEMATLEQETTRIKQRVEAALWSPTFQSCAPKQKR